MAGKLPMGQKDLLRGKLTEMAMLFFREKIVIIP
jgi:hypothetical protein